MAAALVDTATPVGAGALLALLFGYLFKELRRKDDSVWQIIHDRDVTHEAALKEKDAERERRLAEKDAERERAVAAMNAQIEAITRDRDFWRRRTLDAEDEAQQGIIDRQHQRDRGEEPTG